MRRAKAENGPARNGLPAAILVVGIFLAGWSECAAADGDVKSPAKVDLPSDLDLVPRDAAGFVHVHGADLWQSDWAKDIRHFVDKAGSEAWSAFEKKCPLDPATLDRITLILLTPETVTSPFPQVDPEALSAVVVVNTRKPYDRLALIRALGPREKVYRQNVYYFNEELWSGLVPVDERTFLIGSEDALVRLFQMSRQNKRSGPLDAALAEAARKHHMVVGLNPTLLAKEPGAQFMPPPMHKLLGARSGILTLDLDQGLRLDVRLDFVSDDQAREGEKGLRDTLELARQGLSWPIGELEKTLHDPAKSSVADLPENFGALMALGFLRDLDTLLKQAPVQRQDLAVKVPLRYGKTHLGDPAGLPMVSMLVAMTALGTNASKTFATVSGRIGEPAKDPVEEHLRNLAQALDKYRVKHGSYPPQAIYDREGRPVLSWRVALLPYLGEEALYNEFKLDEPWDSLHNKRLLKKLPNTLKSPNSYRWGAGRWKATTQVFTGKGTLFEGKKGLRKPEAAKGAILLAHLTDNEAVYWTKPADLAYAPDKPLPVLFGKYGPAFQVLLADGTYRTIDRTTEEKALRALIQRSGDEPPQETRAPQLGQLEAIWNDFTMNDEAGTTKAWQGISTAIKSPAVAVPFLKQRVQVVPRVDADRLNQWLADLDSEDFKTREKATKELEGLGELAVSALEKKIGEKTLSLEARRRLETLLQNSKTSLSGEELRGIRAVEVLEGIGTPDALVVLDKLAHGGEGAVVTEHARKAVARLAQRSGSK